MRKKLDINTQTALIGFTDSSQIKHPVQHECEGCGRTILFTGPMLDQAKNDVALDGREVVLVCRNCLQPWIDEVAIGNGTFEATPSVAMQEVLPALMESRDRYMRSVN